MKKLKEDKIQGTLIAIQFKLFLPCLLPKNLKIKIYKTLTLSVLLYGCTTLRGEHRLRVFENRELRTIYGPKKEEVTFG